MTERSVLFTGVGGQGVQICSKTLATAANDEDRYCMLIARYGWGMRGGMTNAEVTVGDAPLRALPFAPSAWAAFVMSAAHWGTVASGKEAGQSKRARLSFTRCSPRLSVRHLRPGTQHGVRERGDGP